MMQPNPEIPSLLAVEGLVKTYPGSDEPALKGVSLSVAPGEFFGLLGPNGAGKTTLIGLLCGLLKADAGRTLVQGRDTARDLASVKAKLGVVPQDIALYPSLSARENLRFFGGLQGLSGTKLEGRIQVWLERLGLAGAADRPVGQYSGGMKRRANLIAGLLHGPSLLVLDEPTAGVDPQSRLLIYENLSRLNKDGVTLLYTTHYLKEAEELCSRVAILDRGLLIAQGSPAELAAAHPGAAPGLEGVFIRLTGRELRD
jgi:ABC-2 type transport system ATP-binding protein